MTLHVSMHMYMHIHVHTCTCTYKYMYMYRGEEEGDWDPREFHKDLRVSRLQDDLAHEPLDLLDGHALGHAKIT